MEEPRRDRPHGWMWLQESDATLDRGEWQEWLERGRRGRAGEGWFMGDATGRYPSKADLTAAGLEAVVRGWIPPEPLIRPDSRVVAFGSCFAAHFVEWLATHGYNQTLTELCRALLRNPFENALVVAQQFRWAFGDMDPAHALWIDKQKQRVQATEERRLALRQTLLDADVFVTTLGISEVWYDKATGEPLWRVMPVSEHDPERHGFKVVSVAETIEAFETIERIRARWLPKLRVIYTVSPVPLSGTFRAVSPLTANAASKAIIRAALDEFLRTRPDAINRTYFYFPGYEVVTAFLSSPFTADNRHLTDYAIDRVIELFVRFYTTHTPASASARAASSGMSEVDETRHVIAQLETQNRELQSVSAERLAVIDDLKRACDERLALIESLTRTCDERQAVIEQLTRATDDHR